MAINLSKYKESLSAAWKDVLSDKSDTNWALFSYEGQTNDLKVVSKGSGGIEEMIDDLNSGKIMYAFLKVNDPKTSLPKCVLINWQGEGANIVRKGTCANHVRDVGNFFTGAHVTLNARNEEEVEPQLIIDKVSKSSGSAYSFKAPRSEHNGPTKPIGTNYQRVNPVKEINSVERNQFWLKEEQEEKNRIEEEKKRREAEKIKLEAELKQREIHEAAGREAIDKRRNETIEEMRRAEAIVISTENKSISDRENERLEHDLASSEQIINRSDLLRRQRNEEAQQLIGKSTSNARSIFEQNTAAGQMRSSHPPGKPLRNHIPVVNVNSISNSNNPLIEDNPQSMEVPKSPIKTGTLPESEMLSQNNDDGQGDSDEQDQFSTIKRSPKSPNDVNNENSRNTELFNVGQTNPVIESAFVYSEKRRDEKLPQIVTEQQIVDEVIYQDLGDDLGLQAKALYDYQAADDTEITFDPGDIITHIDQIDEGWWQGLGPDGTFGLFPANYVELLPQ